MHVIQYFRMVFYSILLNHVSMHINLMNKLISNTLYTVTSEINVVVSLLGR